MKRNIKIIELVNNSVTEGKATLLTELVLWELNEPICTLCEEMICEECGECNRRCCMDSMKTCDSCLCC